MGVVQRDFGGKVHRGMPMRNGPAIKGSLSSVIRIVRIIMIFLLVFFWISLFYFLATIYYNTARTMKLTNQLMDQEEFIKSSEEIVEFFKDHWFENFVNYDPVDGERVFPPDPMRIPYTVYDVDHQFLAALSRGIISDPEDKIYQVVIDGQKMGEVQIHKKAYYEPFYGKIKACQIMTNKSVKFCIVLLAFYTGLGLLKTRKRAWSWKGKNNDTN